MSGIGSTMAYAIGKTGGFVLCFAEELYISWWLAKQARLMKKGDLWLSKKSKEEAEISVTRILDVITRYSDSPLLTRKGYPNRHRKPLIKGEVLAGGQRLEGVSVDVLCVMLEAVILQHWLISPTYGLLQLQYSWTCRLLEIEEEGARTRGLELLPEVVLCLCDCLAADDIPLADVLSFNFQYSRSMLEDLLAVFEETISRTIISFERQIPFLGGFIARSAHFFSQDDAFKGLRQGWEETDTSVLYNLLGLLKPLSLLDEHVRQACIEHLNPLRGLVPSDYRPSQDLETLGECLTSLVGS